MKYILFVTIGIVLALWVVSKSVHPTERFAQNTAEWNQLHQLDQSGK